MHPELRPDDLEVFAEAITHFFSTATGEPAGVRSAYLLEPRHAELWNDFNGLIEIGGDYRGHVRFSAPRALLSHVLLKMGETVFTDERHGDIVGEIANTLSGRARRHFGEGLRIAPPRLLDAAPLAERPAEAPPGAARPYAIPLRWHGYEAHLVVQLTGRS